MSEAAAVTRVRSVLVRLHVDVVPALLLAGGAGALGHRGRSRARGGLGQLVADPLAQGGVGLVALVAAHEEPVVDLVALGVGVEDGAVHFVDPARNRILLDTVYHDGPDTVA